MVRTLNVMISNSGPEFAQCTRQIHIARLVVFQSAQCKFAKPDSKWLFAVPQQNEYAHDPIPAKAIRLSDAYARVLEAVNANPKILETLEDHLRKDLLKSKKLDEQSDNWLIASAAEKGKFHREKEVTVFSAPVYTQGSCLRISVIPKLGRFFNSILSIGSRYAMPHLSP